MKNKKLNLAITLTLACMLSPFHAQATTHTVKIDDSTPALMQIYIDDMSKPFVNFNIYSNTSTGNNQYRDFLTNANDIIGGTEKDALINSLIYTKELLGHPYSTPSINLNLLNTNNGIASAESNTIANGATVLGEYFKNPNAQNSQILIDGEQNYPTTINVSKLSPQWYAGEYGSLPNNGPYNALSATFTHELMHALGVYTSTYTQGDKFYLGEPVATGSNGETQIILNQFTKHIYDIYGTQAQVGMEIVPISIEEYTDDAIERDSNKFYVFDRYKKDDSYQDLRFTPNGGISFRGDNVAAALTTDGALSTEPAINWPDNCSVPSVNGIPVNGIELNMDANGEIYQFTEMSHLELQNSLLSHQLYRNWQTLMEAEIALLQDLGYDIDRKRFFGSSIYASGLENFVNTKPYYARLEDGSGWDGTNASTQDWGVGLHVYGSNNKITQTAPLLADGNYANGIRLEGQANNLNIATNITANGKNGNGLLVSYGKKHNITLNEEASIIANGDGGVGARFDFGDNMLGQCGLYMEYRASYYRLIVLDAVNRILESFPPISGELVTNFNVNGHLEGKGVAIYIAHNALVKNININEGATLKGDIISHWSPTTIPIDKISRGEYTTLVDYNTGQLVNWDLKLPEGEDGLTYLNFNANMHYDNNIIGKESIVANIKGNKLSFNGTADVCGFNVDAGATLGGNGTINLYDYNPDTKEYILGAGKFINNGTVAPGNSIGTLTINGDYVQAPTGNLLIEFDNAGNDKLVVNGRASLNGTLTLKPMPDYYYAPISIKAVEAHNIDNNYTVQVDSPSLKLEPSTSELATTEFKLLRQENPYSQYGYNQATSRLAQLLDANFDNANAEWQKIYGALDASSGDGSGVRSALKQLNPSVFSSSAQATLNTHNMLNTMNMLGSFSNNIPAAVTGGGRGPAVDAAPQYNAWRNIVMPFSAYTDQHHGMRGFTNHNSGVIGAMERTLHNGLTHGYHAALNHQSTSEAGSRIKGEGLYLGTQATYAPADWNGWSVFGSARLGLEQMRSHRNINIGGYTGTADADWTGYSGSLSLGTALTKEHGVMQSGPFAALDYSFAHRPSVHEDGDAIRTNLESATYDSLRTQLGYRLTTKPKALDSYDSTQWQAHASVAWNHELLGDNGSTTYQLADLPGVTITDKAETYGRDSMSIAAGITFKTPKRLDVGLTLGSDIYRHGGSSIYGKMNFEWKF